MKKKIVNLMLLAATMVAASGAFVSCKDYCEDDINELKGQLADQNASLTNLITKQQTELQNQITALQTAQNQCAQNCEAIKTSLNNYLTKLEAEGLLSKTDAAATYLSKADAANVYVTLERYNSEYLNYQAADALLQDAINTAKAALQARDAQQSDSIKSLAEQFLTLNGTVIEVSAKAQQALALAQKTQALAESDSIRIDGLSNSLTSLETTVTTLQTTVNNLNLISWTDNEFTTVKANAEAALAATTAQQTIIEGLQSSVSEINQALAKLDEGFVEKVSQQGESITAIISDVTELKTLVETLNTSAAAAAAENAETLGELKDALSESEKTMKSDLAKVDSKINSINKALMSYVDEMFAHYISGIIIQGTYNHVFGEAALPIGANTQILALFYGEAPSQGIEFPTVRGRYYVNQDDIPLTEEDLERIGVAEVYTAEEGKLLVDESDGNAGTLYFTVNPTSANLSQANLELVNSLDEVAPVVITGAYPSDHKLGFGWTRSASNGFWETAVTISPENVKKFVPTIYLNADSTDIIKKAKAVKDAFNRKTTADLAASVFAMSGTVLDAYGMKTTWFDSNGKHSVLSTYSLAIASIKPLSYAFLNDANYKTAPGYERLIDEINGIKSLQKPSRKDARADIISYVDKLNDFICKTINDFNDFLQPTLLAESNNVIFRVSAKENGSDVKGTSIKLYPTSYTGEFLAPAFKKFVAVSNIYKNGESIGDEAVKAFNAANNLQFVLPGNATTIKLEGLQSGCVYEVVYSALDYSGKVVTNKYYLNVQ